MEENMNNAKRPPLFKVLFTLGIVFFLAIPGAPAKASEYRFTSGDWWGTFIFSFSHIYNAASPEEGVVYNDYSLESEKAIGSLAFTVSTDGTIAWSVVRFPRIEYYMFSRQLVSYEVPCQGFAAVGGGVARISTTSSGVLQRMTTDGLFTSPISIEGGLPFVEYTGVGSCNRKEVVPVLIESIQWDLASMIASPWAFQADSITDNKVSGTCSTEPWTTIDRSLECTWQAFLSK